MEISWTQFTNKELKQRVIFDFFFKFQVRTVEMKSELHSVGKFTKNPHLKWILCHLGSTVPKSGSFQKILFSLWIQGHKGFFVWIYSMDSTKKWSQGEACFI